MKPIPLFGSGIRALADIVTRQRRVNCFYDIRQDQDRSTIIVRSTPGSYVWLTLPTAPIYGFHVVGLTLYVVAGTVLYSITTGGSVNVLGPISTAAQSVWMEDNGFQIFIVDGVKGYISQLPSGTPVAISDPTFTSTLNGATSSAYLDARFIVPQPNSRKFYISAQNDGSVWPGGLFQTKENSSDLLVAVDVMNGLLILWGQLSMEFWQDTGGSPFPFQRVQGATQQWGLAALSSRAHFSNTMVFLGRNPDGGLQVLMLNGYIPVRISTSDIEDIISAPGFFVADAEALVYMVAGHSMYQLTFPTSKRTFFYDNTTKIWGEAQTGLTPEVNRHYADSGIAFNSVNLFCDDNTGNIYQFSTAAYTDNGTQILRQMATRHIRADGNTVSLSELFLDFEVGVSTRNVMVAIRVSRNGGRSFGPQKLTPIGELGKYLTRVVYRRLGSGRDFVILISMTDAVPFVIASGSAVIEADQD